MEIRNVDVSEQAFCGKGGYTTPLKILWGRLQCRFNTEKKWDKFLQKKAGNNKGMYLILDIILTREGEWILYNSPIEKSTF